MPFVPVTHTEEEVAQWVGSMSTLEEGDEAFATLTREQQESYYGYRAKDLMDNLAALMQAMSGEATPECAQEAQALADHLLASVRPYLSSEVDDYAELREAIVEAQVQLQTLIPAEPEKSPPEGTSFWSIAKEAATKSIMERLGGSLAGASVGLLQPTTREEMLAGAVQRAIEG